ncbi:SDR family oxidoreductase [Gordonia sp. TBRC 11910]|uniref:SDR family oxidoreductase n=1 Tax=Gordonia asplenii TaxID=2725283 RepID=A0A848KZI9_9ACTN|nr:SDR family oxidoreductase [Gordonia asplenii]NMO03819.1 SDR family oxidoreductase [Gordonia asplenii]
MSRNSGKSILITGGGSGIGAAIARMASASDMRVLIADINEHAAQQVANDIGSSATAINLDIRDSEQWNEVLDKAWELFGGLDILVNNAAIARPGYVRSLQVENHHETIDVNAMGPIRGMTATLPRFREQGSGHFVTICSMTGFLPFPGLASYAAAKHALRAFHHGLAMEERHSGLDFSIIHPTSTETPMLELEATSDEVPMAFLVESVTADHVAEVVLEAVRLKSLEVFMPPSAADTVRSVGTNADQLMAMAEEAEKAGAANLAARRARESEA